MPACPPRPVGGGTVFGAVRGETWHGTGFSTNVLGGGGPLAALAACSLPLRDTPSRMSRNLELVRSIYAARARGDYSSAEWHTPISSTSWLTARTPVGGRGGRALADVMRDWMT